MKKLGLIFLMAFISCAAYGQKIVVNEVDKFTGQRLVETSIIKTSRPNFEYKLRQVNDSLFISTRAESLDFVVEPNMPTKINIITANGDRIDLLGRIEKSTINEARTGIHWGFGISSGNSRQVSDVIMFFFMPKETLNLLCDNKITDIRITVGTENYDYEVDKSVAKKFTKLFNLLRN